MTKEQENFGVNLIDVWDQFYGRSDEKYRVGQPQYLHLFTGFRQFNEQGKSVLASPEERYYLWPDEAGQAANWTMEQSENGREVYQCAHLLRDTRRVKENAVSPRILYADGDGATIPSWMPEPNIVIETSPNRHQYGWTLTEPMDLEDFEQLNKQITYALGADKSRWALSSLLRVPGTKNHKYENTPTVHIQRLADEAYDPKQIEQALLAQDSSRVFGDYSEGNSKSSEWENEPPVVLDEYGMQVWLGKDVKLDENGGVDRSASLLKLARVLYDAGATRRTIVEALGERDAFLGWNKYSDRKDPDSEYHRIVNKLEITGRYTKDSAHALKEKGKGTHQVSMITSNPLGTRIELGEVIRQGIEPPEELVEDILLKGKVHQVFAGPGCGKSWLALWLIVKLINEGRPVLYLDTENGKNIVAERLEALGAAPERLKDYLHYYFSPALTMSTESTDVYVSELERIDPALVVFDSWVNFLTGADLDENVSSDIARWASKYTHPARSREITVLILDHVPKEGLNSRGSGRKKEEVDVQWQLKNPLSFDRNTVGEIRLKREKDREGWLPEQVKFSVGGTEEGFLFEELDKDSGTANSHALKPTEKKILKVLTDVFGSEGARASEWQKASEEVEGISRPTFYRVKENLTKGIHYHKDGKRFYPLVNVEVKAA